VLSGSDATKELQAAIEQIDRKNAWQTKLMLGPTFIAAVIAAVPVVQGWLK
jgi:hypothetical protein